jgi:AraC-like DNA-binding protein
MACIARSTDRLRLAEHGISISLFERAKQIIDGELQSSKLRPATLCRQLGVSRSQLYRLFERKGGVTHYIQRQRLIRIFDTLCNPEDRRPISAVAADFCFDPSSFGRAFRREFWVWCGRCAGLCGCRSPIAGAQANSLRRQRILLRSFLQTVDRAVSVEISAASAAQRDIHSNALMMLRK